MPVTVDDVRAFAATLPRSSEAFVRGRVKFRVGRIVFLSFSNDETVMGFGFPKDWRTALVESDPEKFSMPSESDLRFHWIHVVDLNGAVSGAAVNGAAVEAILEAVSVPVQLGGGIRTLADIERWIGEGRLRQAGCDLHRVDRRSKFHDVRGLHEDASEIRVSKHHCRGGIDRAKWRRPRGRDSSHLVQVGRVRRESTVGGRCSRCCQFNCERITQ